MATACMSRSNVLRLGVHIFVDRLAQDGQDQTREAGVALISWYFEEIYTNSV